ncbi:NupC/NupG family nucleoside CNT transporter [Listeria sp. PSOL-1]|uniref:NupC/NupG family nucleoside CNT transporter n=1 Tax=Listeria sp. PSOL-1 TaxID=1844999 RepID=UPI0013D83000|nr:nucleoside transporter C-terminal domain-containing protein [Listeria sp. PSOL-1]
MKFLIFILGIAVPFLIAFLASSDRKKIRIKPIILMLVVQIALAYILLNTSAGLVVIKGISNMFGAILGYAKEGVDFVFGGIANKGEAPFFLTVLLPIVFISALIGILHHFKILQLIIRAIGFLISKINGLGKLESYNAIAAAILGQSEVFITLKDQLKDLPSKRLYTLCASAMSTVSMTVVGSYMTLIEPKYVVTALVLNLFSGFTIIHIINPYTVSPEEDILEINEERRPSFFEMLSEYIMLGFTVAVTVGAMLIGFIALIGGVNGVFDSIFGISFQEILGYVFAPFAFIMGVPAKDIVEAGSIMATKLVTNEFVAMIDLTKVVGDLTPKTVGIISTFLVSFANFSSIGIIVGATKSIDKTQANVVAKFGLKLLLGATLVSLVTGAIVGLML